MVFDKVKYMREYYIKNKEKWVEYNLKNVAYRREYIKTYGHSYYIKNKEMLGA